MSFAGDDDRQDINDLIVEPLLNINLPDRWFTTIAPEVRFNLDHEADVFIPFDITVGRKVNDRTVVSRTWDAALSRDYEQYDWQLEGRVGVFF